MADLFLEMCQNAECVDNNCLLHSEAFSMQWLRDYVSSNVVSSTTDDGTEEGVVVDINQGYYNVV
jgi:hypothetical protein